MTLLPSRIRLRWGYERCCRKWFRSSRGMWLLVLMSLVVFVCLLQIHRHQTTDGSPSTRLMGARSSRFLRSVANDPTSIQVLDVFKFRPKSGSEALSQILGSPSQQMNRLAPINQNTSFLSNEYYRRILEKRGQVTTDQNNRITSIISVPDALIRIPLGLKHINYEDLDNATKVWFKISHYPWPRDPECANFSIQFANYKALPIVGLVSYPGSGNTWLRYLIEGASGWYSGSEYHDYDLCRKGFYGESVPFEWGMTVVAKSHGFTTVPGAPVLNGHNARMSSSGDHQHMDKLNRTAILLIRNPFRALIAHRHLDEGGHKGFAKRDSFIGQEWEQFVREKIELWENLYLEWLMVDPGRTLVLHYELIHQQIHAILHQIMAFLQLPAAHPDRISCVLRHPTGQFLRRDRNRNETTVEGNPFSPEQIELIRRSIDRVHEALITSGKPPLPLDYYEFLTSNRHHDSSILK